MNILAVDTSTKVCVLGISAGQKIHTNEEIVDRSHSKVILPSVVALLAEAGLGSQDLDLIVYGQGPGSFTGLRIGVGIVQGLAFGLEIPVVAVSGMACLAQGAYRLDRHEHCLVALTARAEEVYFGSYSVADESMVKNGLESVGQAREISRQDANKEWVGVGSGWNLREQLEAAAGVSVTHIVPESYPSAVDLLHLGVARYQQGLSTSALEAKPEYLREIVASLPES